MGLGARERERKRVRERESVCVWGGGGDLLSGSKSLILFDQITKGPDRQLPAVSEKSVIPE